MGKEMRIEIKSYTDGGNIEEERIGFEVKESCNLKFFAVCHTKKTTQGFYNRPYHMFWFYPKDVAEGDEIVLYTKQGVDNTEERNGRSIHFFYWGLKEPIIKDGQCVVLSEIDDWELKVF